MIQTGKGLLAQINENHYIRYTINKEEIRECLMSISDENYETLWKKTFGETYEEFINKMLENEL